MIDRVSLSILLGWVMLTAAHATSTTAKPLPHMPFAATPCPISSQLDDPIVPRNGMANLSCVIQRALMNLQQTHVQPFYSLKKCDETLKSWGRSAAIYNRIKFDKEKVRIFVPYTLVINDKWLNQKDTIAVFDSIAKSSGITIEAHFGVHDDSSNITINYETLDANYSASRNNISSFLAICNYSAFSLKEHWIPDAGLSENDTERLEDYIVIDGTMEDRFPKPGDFEFPLLSSHEMAVVPLIIYTLRNGSIEKVKCDTSISNIFQNIVDGDKIYDKNHRRIYAIERFLQCLIFSLGVKPDLAWESTNYNNKKTRETDNLYLSAGNFTYHVGMKELSGIPCLLVFDENIDADDVYRCYEKDLVRLHDLYHSKEIGGVK